jgi:hypothetical protein
MLKRLSVVLALFVLAQLANAAPQWPKCSIKNGVEGGPAIMVNGSPYTPFMFIMGDKSEKDDVLIRELSLAAETGIRLFAMEIPLDDDSSNSPGDAAIDAFCKANPEGYFMVRISLSPDEKWRAAHPGDCVVKRSPETAAPQEKGDWISPTSEAWREHTAAQLRKRVREIAEGPHGDKFIGVTIQYLHSGQWLYSGTNGFMDYSAANLAAFRRWLKREYKREKALKTAWGRDDVTFETAEFPSPEERSKGYWGPFREPTTQRPSIDMSLFQNISLAETIEFFAKTIKEATERRSLVGACYGNLMEMNDNDQSSWQQSGRLALGKLLNCRDIDILHGPFSNFQRAPGQTGHLQTPVDSIALHGKIEICEEDMHTHLSQKPEENTIAPCWEDRAQNIQDTLSIMRRDFGISGMHRCGMGLSDILSDGRWNERVLWDATRLFRRISAESRSVAPFQPEIAFIVNETSPAYMRDDITPVLQQSLSLWRSEIDRLGAPVGYYLQSDLPRVPHCVKFYILANPFMIAKEEMKALQSALDRGATILWNYAPNFVNPDGLNPSGMEEASGITVEAKFDDVPIKIASSLTDEVMDIDPAPWRPRFVVSSKDVDPIAKYVATGEVSAAARKSGKGVNIYTATPRLPVELTRELCRRAGVHLYTDTPGMTAVIGDYLFFHTDKEAMFRFAWTEDCRAVHRVIPPRSFPMSLEDENKWSDRLPANFTAIYARQ